MTSGSANSSYLDTEYLNESLSAKEGHGEDVRVVEELLSDLLSSGSITFKENVRHTGLSFLEHNVF